MFARVLAATLLITLLQSHLSLAFNLDRSAKVPGSIPQGLTIPNARYVGTSKQLIRGRAPADNVIEFSAAGINHILIIKNQVTSEVDDEITELKKTGIAAANIRHIPYRWKDINQLQACEQTIDALEYIHATIALPKNKLYFHCTAGVDRTGLVAALYRLQTEPKSTSMDIFKNEMCGHGYGDATYFRPKHVKETIHNELTPLYIKIADVIVSNRANKEKLSKDFCKAESFQNPTLEKKVAESLNKYKCR